MKTCTKCGETKTLDCFSKHNLTKDGKSTQCKACRNKIYTLKYGQHKKDNPNYGRIRKLRLKYNLTIEEYNSIATRQFNRCMICNKYDNKLFVDHCHATGKVRGLLCNTCNTGIGLLKEDIIILENAIKYLTISP